jgi:SAM-dependent methyltransferase
MVPCLVLLLNTCAFLVLETGLLRVLTVAQWYHVAFLALSTALLGGGLGPVLLCLRPPAPASVPALVLALLCALPPTVALSFLLFNLLPFEPLLLLHEPLQLAVAPLGCLLLGAPFLLAGLVTALLFMSPGEATPGRRYAFDLLGAALGAPLFLVVLPIGGAWGLVFAAAGIWALAAALYGSRALPAGRRALPLLLLVGSLACLAGLMGFPFRPRLPLRITRTKITATGEAVAQVLADPRRTLTTGWGGLGRVDVVRAPSGYRLVMDAGAAVSRVVRPERTRAEAPDLDHVLQQLRPRSVLVIGAGGGLEVQLALRAGAERVVAVEMNPLLLRLALAHGEGGRGGLRDPRVTIVEDEGRHFLLGSPERFDLILCVHTISNAALASGGLTLAESYALTREAFADYYRHLTPRGALLFTRPRGQMARLYLTAAAGWRTAAAGWPAGPAGDPAGDPASLARRTLLYERSGPLHADRFYAVLLWLAGEDEDTEGRIAGLLPGLRALGFAPMPREADGAPPASPRALTEPATDDRPFFNQHLPLSRLRLADLRAVLSDNQRLSLEDQPVAELALLVLSLQVILVGGALFLLPLRGTGAGRGRTGAYFALLGAAYLLCEVALLQQLALYLGQPAYAAAVVLGGMLLFSGLGSATARASTSAARACLSAAAAVALTTLLLSLSGPRLLSPIAGAPFPLRVGAALLLLLPGAFLMGRPFPAGLRALSPAPAPAPAPAGAAVEPQGPRIAWAFATNGLASVGASALAPLFSMGFGLRAALLVAAGLYLGAAWLARRL